MNCPNCGSANPDGAKFCNECGNQMQSACPECGKTNQPGSKFCNECGHDLRKPKEAAPIDYDRPKSYKPKFLAEKILTSRSAIEGERKLVTVMFADVAGFTAMSEKLDPEEVHEIMDGCFRILMDEIHRFEGTVNEFTGDGVMALFGAPLAHENHAQRACQSALAAQKALVPYAGKLRREYGVDFKVRIGLNSGPVVVGTIGDDLRMDYTAQGDTANLAARMESNAKPGGVLVSEQTYKVARDFFEFKSVGEIEIKGKQVPHRAYELEKPTDIETRMEASVARGLKELVGRDDALETLFRAFGRAKRGDAQVVDVVGEAGIGKSRLVYEFEKAVGDDAVFLTGVCAHYGRNINFLPVIDIVRAAFGIQEGMTEEEVGARIEQKAADALAPMTPFYRNLLSLPVDDPMFAMLDAEGRKFGTFEAVKNLLLAGSTEKPLVVFLEDVHWIDKISEDLFTFFSRCILDHPILMLSAYRPEGSPCWAHGAHYQRLGLETLSSKSSIRLVRNMLGGLPLDSDLEQKIAAKTGGNPFFVEEIVRELLERGDIVETRDGYMRRIAMDKLQIPDTVQGVLAARMDRLSEDLKATMQVASVIGRDFAFRILKSIMALGEELRVRLTNLVGLEILYEKALYPELEYIFKHALTQEVAYESMLKQKRRELHGRIAQAIEELFPDRLDEHCEMLAHHYGRGGDAEKAVRYLLLAGEKSNRQDAVQNANDFFERAFETVEKADLSLDTETRVRLYFGWALANAAVGAIGKAVEGFNKSVELAREHGFTEYERLGLYQLCVTSYVLPSKKDAEQIVNQGIARARETDDKSLESINLSMKAILMALYGRPNAGFEMIHDAEHTAMESGDRRALLTSKLFRAFMDRWLGRPGNAVQSLDTLYEMLRHVYAISSLMVVKSIYGIALAEIGFIDKALAFLTEAIDLCEKFGSFQRLGVLQNTVGYCYSEICLPGPAWRSNMESKELAERQMTQFPMGMGLYAEIRAQANVNLMENLFDQGNMDEAMSMLESFKEESASKVYNLMRHQWESRMNYLLAQILLHRCDLDNASAIIEDNLPKVRKTHSKKREGGFLRLLGELHLRRGDSDSAISAVNEAILILKEVGNPRQLWQAHGSLGSVFDSLGRSAEAREQWGAAAELIQKTSDGLSDTELREGFLNAKPIRQMLSRAQ
ncbi:adenylate/guanylate cyclase domain-containing protein [Thermodesulfobacteriota bacterium]